MKNFFLILLLSTQIFNAQKSSSLEIVAPNLKVDTIFISYPSATRNTHLLHNYRFYSDDSKKISEQGDIKLALKATSISVRNLIILSQ